MSKPIIGVTKPDRGGLIQNLAIRLGLWFAGASSINISSKHPLPSTSLNGLLISGGTDIYPGLYESEEIKPNYTYDQERDELELRWLEAAKKSKIPIFCICRGAQLLNISEGGTLFTNIQKSFKKAEYPTSLLAKIFFRKKITIEDNSKIKEAIQAKETWVNSMHTQSIDKLGKDLEVSSKETNGIIQSVEHTQLDYVVGVQFHPEFMIYRRDIRRLFSQFVDKCRGVRPD